MKGRSWKLVGVIAGAAVLGLLLGLTIHLAHSTRAANRDLAALRDEIAQQERERSARQTDLVAPITARIDDLSSKLNQQADKIADVSGLGDRVSKLEDEARETEGTPAVTMPETTPAAVPPATSASAASPPSEAAGVSQAPPTVEAQPVGQGQTSSPVSISVAPPIAPQGVAIEVGRFVILQAGVRIGTEDFTLAETGSGYVLSSTLRETSVLGGTALAQKAVLNKSFLPTQYEIHGTEEGTEKTVAVEVAGGKAIATSLGGQVLQAEVQSASLVAALDPAFPSACVVIHRSLGASLGSQPGEWSAFSGEATAFVPLHIEPASAVTVSDTLTRGDGYAYKVMLSGEAIWYYVSGDHVVGFAIPSRELFAYRVDIHPKGLLIFPRTLIELGMPIGVREQEVTLANQGAKLVGTFAAPSSASTKMPAFLLIPDVGSYDRDGNRVGLEARTLRDIARRFAHQGVASYRFDSRGVGASEGDYASVSLASLESDALIALVWLRANPMIDPDKIYIVGYGYGGIVALHLGASGMAHGVATLAMPATSFSASQTTALRARAVVKGVGEEEVDTLANHERSFFDYIRGTTGTWADVILSQVRASLPWMDEVEYARQTSEIPLPLLRDLARLDPLDAVRAAKCRLFILNGTKDFDVPASDASVLAQAATDAGNSDVTTAVVGDVNHLLRRHPEDAAALDRHLDAEVDWNVLQPLLNWLGGPVMPGGGTGGPAPIS